MEGKIVHLETELNHTRMRVEITVDINLKTYEKLLGAYLEHKTITLEVKENDIF